MWDHLTKFDLGLPWPEDLEVNSLKMHLETAGMLIQSIIDQWQRYLPRNGLLNSGCQSH